MASLTGYAGNSPEMGPTWADARVMRLRPTPADVVRRSDLSGRMERRTYLRAVRRHYPPALRRAEVTGEVTVRLRVDRRGKARVLETVRGDPRFFDAARAVVNDLYLSGTGENLMVISFPAARAVVAGRSY